MQIGDKVLMKGEYISEDYHSELAEIVKLTTDSNVMIRFDNGMLVELAERGLIRYNQLAGDSDELAKTKAYKLFEMLKSLGFGATYTDKGNGAELVCIVSVTHGGLGFHGDDPTFEFVGNEAINFAANERCGYNTLFFKRNEVIRGL